MAMSKPRLIWICLALTAGSAVMAVALVVLSRRTMTISEQARAVDKLEADNRELRLRSDQVNREIEILRRQLEEVQAQPEGSARSRAKAELPAGTLEAVRTLGQLRESLENATATIDQLRNHTADLQAELDKVKAQNRDLAAHESELDEKLAGANRLIEAIELEMKSKTDRLTPLQTANKSLRQENEQNKERMSRTSAWASQLEDLNRRRETYLSNILRRYRELTEQYRSLSARNTGESGAPSGAEISRIQNTISMTEEDLRQLDNLNAQAEKLRKRLAH